MILSWKIIESEGLSSEAIMAKDLFLLEQLRSDDHPLLHLYEWGSPCLTYGYFTDPNRYLELEALEDCGLQATRRPTGGGIIFHLSDLAFSILIPASHPRFSLNPLNNYAFINQKVAEVISKFTTQRVRPELNQVETSCHDLNCLPFCMAKPTRYDLIVEGKKVGGAAQRRTRHGLLHQASISLLFPPIDLLRKILKNQESVVEAMQTHSHCLLSESATLQQLQAARQGLREILRTSIKTL